MKFFVKIKVKQKEQKVEKFGADSLVVSVKNLPIEGKANQELLEVLAKHFQKPKSSVRIISGFKSRVKIIEV